MSHMTVNTQKVVKLSSIRLENSGVQRKGIVEDRVKAVCCQLRQMSAEQGMSPQEARNVSGLQTRRISGELVQQAQVFV
jgi:hypothetical protein